MTSKAGSGSPGKIRPVAPTVRDVAAASGFSPMTVSRVANGGAGVSPATAARVRAAMAEVGFRPNRTARNLRQSRTFTTIALVIEDSSSPFYSTVTAAAEQVAREHEALVVVANSGEDPARERDVVEMLMQRGVDGLLVFPAGSAHGHLGADPLGRPPMVFLGRPPTGIEADAVLVANEDGAVQAVHHLVGHGHRRIALIGDDASLYTTEARHRGYRTALEATGLSYDPGLVRLGCQGATGARAAVEELMARPEPPTALFTVNNRMTVGAVRALGRDASRVALVGFDDFELADLLVPAVTVVSQDAAEMGRRAAEMLFGRLAGQGRPVERVTLPVSLILRGSGEIAPRS